jgi:hypothetical protein
MNAPLARASTAAAAWVSLMVGRAHAHQDGQECLVSQTSTNVRLETLQYVGPAARAPKRQMAPRPLSTRTTARAIVDTTTVVKRPNAQVSCAIVCVDMHVRD